MNLAFIKGYHRILAAILLFSLAFICYFPSTGFDFVNFDDYAYVHYNSRIHHVTLDALLDIWNPLLTATDPFPEFQPIRDLSLMIDYQLYGLNASGFHLTNILFHSLNVVLLFSLLQLWFRSFWLAFCSSFIFALHPVHVESIAWVTSRKDVLGLFFFMGSLLFFSYSQKHTKPKLKHLGTLFYILGILSKSQVIFVPFILILKSFLEDSNLKKWNHKYILIIVAPYKGLLIVLFLYLTLFLGLQFSHPTNTIDKLYALGYEPHPAAILQSIAYYLKNIFYPYDLLPYYELNQELKNFGPMFWIGLFTIIVFIGLIFKYRNNRHVPITFLALICMLQLAPVLNILPHPIWIADRYLYFVVPFFYPLFFILLDQCFSKKIWVTVCFILSIPLFLQAQKQLQIWSNGMNLWERVYNFTDTPSQEVQIALGNAYVFHNNCTQGMKILKPIEHFAYKDLHYQGSRGRCAFQSKNYTEAEYWFLLANQNKKEGISFSNLGETQNALGKIDLAIESYKECTLVDPKFLNCFEKLGQLYARQNLFKLSAQTFKNALKIAPRKADLWFNYALSMAKQGKTKEAFPHFQHALALDPQHQAAQRAMKLY